jgi:hypothetical protein
MFNLDTEVSYENILDATRSTIMSQTQSELIPSSANMFQWTKFFAKNDEFKIEK